MTGIFRCFDWKAAEQKYEAIDCPASEESHGGPSEPRKITSDEVTQLLASAREVAQAERKSRSMEAKQPLQAPITSSPRDVGIVLPANLRPGTRVSGSVTDDPSRFESYPDLLVTRVKVPFESEGAAATLSGWTLESKDVTPQPAEGPFSFVVPAGTAAVDFVLRQAGDPSRSVSAKVSIAAAKPDKSAAVKDYESSALCFRGAVCVVEGPFSGDSRSTFVAFDKVPAAIIAEDNAAAYIDVPMTAIEGQSALIVAEGSKVAAMVVVVACLKVEPAFLQVEPGQSSLGQLFITNAGELAGDQWRYGIFPPSSLQQARELIPGFKPANAVEQDRERRERQEKRDWGGKKKKEDPVEESAGMVLVVVHNTTPDVATLRGAKQHSLVFHLVPESFGMGEFKYSFGIDPVKSGTLRLEVAAIPFLAPVKAQVFPADVRAKNEAATTNFSGTP